MNPLTEENDKMNSHPAPREQLSERVQRLAHFADAHCSEDEMLVLLVRAIREQQAALADITDAFADYGGPTYCTPYKDACAVIEKWRIE